MGRVCFCGGVNQGEEHRGVRKWVRDGVSGSGQKAEGWWLSV